MTLKTIFTPLHPFRLISLLMTYALGAGLVQYVDRIRDQAVMIQGGVLLLLIVLLVDYLHGMQTLQDERTRPVNVTKENIRQWRWAYGLIAATLLTAATSLVIRWMVQDILSQEIVFLLLAALVSGVFIYLSSGWEAIQPYQILFEVLLIVVIPPAMAFFLQSPDSHRFLSMVVQGLVPAYLAFRLLEQLIQYGQDQQLELKTIGTMIGWENTMVLHNALILLSYLLMALMAILGFPWFLIWPVFLTLPIGLLEIWMMERVRAGGKPLWIVMRIASASVFLIPAYLLAFAFWTR